LATIIPLLRKKTYFSKTQERGFNLKVLITRQINVAG